MMEIYQVFFFATLFIGYEATVLNRKDVVKADTKEFVDSLYNWLDNDEQAQSKIDFVDMLNSYLLFDFTIEREQFEGCLYNLLTSKNEMELIKKLSECTNLNVKENLTKAYEIHRFLQSFSYNFEKLVKKYDYKEITNTVNFEILANLLSDLDSCDPKYQDLQSSVVIIFINHFYSLRMLVPQVGRFSYDSARKYGFFVCYIAEFKDRREAEDILKDMLFLSEDSLQLFKRKVIDTIKSDRFYEKSNDVMNDFLEFLSDNDYLGSDKDMKHSKYDLSAFFESMVKKYGNKFLQYFDMFDGYGLANIEINVDNFDTIVDYLTHLNRWKYLCKNDECPGKTKFDTTLSKFSIRKIKDIQYKSLKEFLIEITNTLKAFRKTDLFDLLNTSETISDDNDNNNDDVIVPPDN